MNEQIKQEIQIIKLALLGILKTMEYPEKEIFDDNEKFKEFNETRKKNFDLTVKMLKENLTKE